jgi:SAM-dependent methyltransferase
MEDFEPGAGTGRDSLFYHQRTDQAVFDEVARRPPGRVLDVACGSGALAARLGEAGWEAWGLEASGHMLGLGRWQGFDRQAVMVRGIAEALPFREGSFDRVLCKGSLDHFADQATFVEEAARILRPDGRLVIALANFDALSRRLGRGIHVIARVLGTPGPARTGPDAAPSGGGHFYWEPPPTHTVRGDLAYVQSLGGRRFALERCYGVSLLHHFRPWRIIVNRLPPRVSWAAITVLDGIARHCPAAGDMIVTVWRPRRPGANTSRPPAEASPIDRRRAPE